jgi:hypothetical protein
MRPADAITEAERRIYEESRADPRLAIKYWQFGVGAGLWFKNGPMDPPGNNFQYGHARDEVTPELEEDRVTPELEETEETPGAEDDPKGKKPDRSM